MIDPNALMLAWLKSIPALTAIVGTNIYCPVLPELFSCAGGLKAVVVRRRGGSRHPEISALLEPSFAIEAWALEAPDAQQIHGILSDQIHGATSVDLGVNGFVILAQEEVSGQDITDPVTRWAMVVSYYRVWLRAAGS